MKAKYLTVGGESINEGEIYFKVNANAPFNINQYVAHGENNVSYACYFKDRETAYYYKYLLEQRDLFQRHIEQIEKNHLNK